MRLRSYARMLDYFMSAPSRRASPNQPKKQMMTIRNDMWMSFSDLNYCDRLDLLRQSYGLCVPDTCT